SEVGAVFCVEASRLARNGRDWHHLIELCGMVGAVVVDLDGIYDPTLTNDRLLLGVKGTISEFEVSLFRQRSMEAIRQKAARGELQISIAVGLDRKSTRLNSSHRTISYAVFCLKKKNTLIPP